MLGLMVLSEKSEGRDLSSLIWNANLSGSAVRSKADWICMAPLVLKDGKLSVIGPFSPIGQSSCRSIDTGVSGRAPK